MPREALVTAAAYAAELEQRDASLAGELARIGELAGRAFGVRARAAEVSAALERVPLELAELQQRRREADADIAAARVELDRAEARVETLESGRRRRVEELERARKESATAREALVDAVARRERADRLEDALRADEPVLVAEAVELARAAGEIAHDVRSARRIAEAAGRDPGETLAALDDWGGRLRSALLVARGALEAERERIAVEANVLGASVLGEELGASSVALVRRRLEEHLGTGS